MRLVTYRTILPGDEAEVERIGVLENRVAAPPAVGNA